MARTAVVKAKKNLPATLSPEMQQELEDLKNRIAAPGGDRLQVTQDKLFQTPNGETSDTVICVIVDFVNANSYYTTPYQQDEITPPVCFAIHPNTLELAPSKKSPDPQSARCQNCSNNQFGSLGKGKACTNTKLLAVLPPDATEETPLMILKVSPTAIKAFDGYVGSISRIHQLPPRGVITEVSFDPNLRYPSLRFRALEPCSAELRALMDSRKAEAMERLMVEPDTSEPQESVPAKAAGGRLKAPVRRKAA